MRLAFSAYFGCYIIILISIILFFSAVHFYFYPSVRIFVIFFDFKNNHSFQWPRASSPARAPAIHAVIEWPHWFNHRCICIFPPIPETAPVLDHIGSIPYACGDLTTWDQRTSPRAPTGGKRSEFCDAVDSAFV